MKTCKNIINELSILLNGVYVITIYFLVTVVHFIALLD